MKSSIDNNKRIVKNTVFLYIRMFLIMAVSLYTSRIILLALGVEDFGIYNVVGGVVAMMSILNGCLGSATSRFLTYELGKNEKKQLHKTFCVSLQIYLFLSVIFLLLAETIGLWFVNHKLVIPESRLIAANWCYQFSIISAINTLLVNPYNASIIAHERMNVYAYVSIIEAMLKLLISFLIFAIPYDKLIVYGFLYLLMSILITIIYRLYCIRKFEECSYQICCDWDITKKMLSFSGWTLFGSLAMTVKGQGLNVLLNMFFNPSVNASRGIAYQINTNLLKFGDSFYTAVRPQITKYYAQKDYDNMIKLVFKSSKLTFFLLLIISLPIIIETPFIINLWLGQMPEYVVEFTRLIIIISLFDSMAAPIMTAINATGKISLYQFLMGSVTIMNLPISYFFLKRGFSPLIVFEVSIVCTLICYFLRVIILRKKLEPFPAIKYIWYISKNILFVTSGALVIPVLFKSFFPSSFVNSIISILIAVVSSLSLIWWVGLTCEERQKVSLTIRNKIYKK